MQNFQTEPPIPARPGRGQRLNGETDAGPTRGASGRGRTNEQSQTSAGLGCQLQPAKGPIVGQGNPSQYGGNARLAEQLIECPSLVLASGRANHQ